MEIWLRHRLGKTIELEEIVPNAITTIPFYLEMFLMVVRFFALARETAPPGFARFHLSLSLSLSLIY
jgi:hypothetical protein